MNVQRLASAIKALGPPVLFYPAVGRLIGIKEALFLAQLIYWTPRSHGEHGWIYKSAEDIEQELSLTYKEQTRLRKRLINLGLIEERYDREQHRLYFRIVAEDLMCLTDGKVPQKDTPKGQELTDEREAGCLQKGESNNEAETTTEITHIEPSPLFAEGVLPASDVKSPDPRHKEFKGLIFRFYNWKFHRDPGWDGGDAAQLSRVLKANPLLDGQTFALWLRNYGLSKDITPGERPRRFLPRIENYSVAPLNQFGRGGTNGTDGTKKATPAEERTERIRAQHKRYAAAQGFTVGEVRESVSGNPEGDERPGEGSPDRSLD